jgi:tripartite-type tricarboxylate transporter receptor subunit TctC
VHVPFAGSSSAYRELLPGRVQAAFVVLDSAVPHLQAGSLRLLAVADPRRNRQFPDTPSLDESFPGLAYDGIFGIVGPARMAAALVQALYADIAAVLKEPAVHAQLERQSMDVLASTPADFTAAIRREILHWRSAVQESGAQVS